MKLSRILEMEMTLDERKVELGTSQKELTDLRKAYKTLKEVYGYSDRNTVSCYARICRLSDWIKFEKKQLEVK